MDGDFEGPTFSLGIDLEHIGGDSDLQVDDSDPETSQQPLKRLRRGATATSFAPFPNTPSFSSNDDIEDSSSQDDLALGYTNTAQCQPMCSTSKTSLPAQGSVVVKSIRRLQSNCQNQGTLPQKTPKGVISGNKVDIPKLVVSPLRKFLLVQSDSEDFLDNHEVSTCSASAENDMLLKRAKSCYGRTEPSGKRLVKESSTGSCQNDDLWKDFLPPKSFNISTPVFDEICEEYFQTVKENTDCKYPELGARIENDGNVYRKTLKHFVQNQPSLNGFIPPAHHYYFHNDMRIRNLVCSRLHNFYPLDALDDRENGQLHTPNIDYRSQFSHGGASTSRRQPNQQSNVAGGSTKGCRKYKSVVEKVSEVSERWVNPRVSAHIPKDAGRRRVRAGGSSDGGCQKNDSAMGRWFTGSDGKRVYISRSGQELTGKLAYLHYKKVSVSFLFKC
uniref:Uncharacterized protein n=1 Tax=Kalanchoe fedtschenkoi TaxID=63787 RepID=A0A7N0VA90_KALFE